jgi:rfaE bifunctional protein nucleotidyltransferase chain/domain
VNSAPEFEFKLTPPQDLKARAAHLPRPIVFTNGVFDLLHRGHVTYLAQARALGRSLIVALNDEAPDRPIHDLADRTAVIAALESVSLVTWFSDDTPLALIESLSPDVLAKGGDWPVEQIVGGQWVLAHGGKVVSIDFDHERSTTATLEKIRKPTG